MQAKKWEIKRVRQKARAVAQRITRLEKADLISPKSEIFKAEAGGKLLDIPRNATVEELVEAERLLNMVFNDVYSTVSGATGAREARLENFKKTLRTVLGASATTDQLAFDLMDYMPYTDLRDFLNDYEYEEVVEMALNMKERGIQYTQELLEIGLSENLTNLILAALLDSGEFSDEDISKGVMYDYALKVKGGTTIQDALQEYRDRNEQFYGDTND